MTEKAKACRSCRSSDLSGVLSLGSQYPVEFPVVGSADNGRTRIPILLQLCHACGLVQQAYSAPADSLYRHYWYRSGVTDTMRRALRDVVQQVEDTVDLGPGDVVVDVGANDGTLLRSYSSKVGRRVAVEPAHNMAQYYADSPGIHLVSDYWSKEAYAKASSTRAKVITAIGMLYDLEDPNQFLSDVRACLACDGVFVAQLQCLAQTVVLGDVGNFCHEHLEFYSLRSLVSLFKRNGLEVFDVEENSVNGGSYRVWARHDLGDDAPASVMGPGRLGGVGRLAEVLRYEESLKLTDTRTYADLYDRMRTQRDRCVDFIQSAVYRGKQVWVYGASTKGTTIAQWYGLDSRTIAAAADKSPEKHGRSIVGTNIPIVSEESFRQCRPDYALIMPYAFAREFAAREAEWVRRGGTFLVPLPKFREVAPLVV